MQLRAELGQAQAEVVRGGRHDRLLAGLHAVPAARRANGPGASVTVAAATALFADILIAALRWPAGMPRQYLLLAWRASCPAQ